MPVKGEVMSLECIVLHDACKQCLETNLSVSVDLIVMFEPCTTVSAIISWLGLMHS